MSGLKILYVEDEPDIRALGTIAMESMGGFTVRVCESGLEALSAATEFGPQLIILDVMMPGMTGPETLTNLRALPTTANTPAIFMTAKSQADDVDRFKAMGAIGVIPKPFDPVSIAGEIQVLWDKSQA
jgi:two-component system OmpR family response regulator